MRKMAGTAAAAGLLAALAMTGVAGAQDGAVVIKGDDCTIGVSEETAFVTFDQQRVLTPSGNRTLVCHGWYDGSSGETIVVKNIVCGIRDAEGGGAVAGTQSHSVLTKSSRVNYTCHFKANKG
jgi:hypothetical protein